MGFTVKIITDKLKVSEPDLTEHRKNFGLRLRNSFQDVFLRTPDKIVEGSYKVFEYPDEFRQKAEIVLKRYMKKHLLQFHAPAIKAKRKRIQVVTPYKC